LFFELHDGSRSPEQETSLGRTVSTGFRDFLIVARGGGVID
jgi:hypothetical protein